MGERIIDNISNSNNIDCVNTTSIVRNGDHVLTKTVSG